MIKKLLNWLLPPLEPKISDVVSVKIIRKSSTGELYENSLSGDDASKWGYLITHRNKTNEDFLSLHWKKTKL